VLLPRTEHPSAGPVSHLRTSQCGNSSLAQFPALVWCLGATAPPQFSPPSVAPATFTWICLQPCHPWGDRYLHRASIPLWLATSVVSHRFDSHCWFDIDIGLFSTQFSTSSQVIKESDGQTTPPWTFDAGGARYAGAYRRGARPTMQLGQHFRRRYHRHKPFLPITFHCQASPSPQTTLLLGRC
jgi:hypothetical protein